MQDRPASKRSRGALWAALTCALCLLGVAPLAQDPAVEPPAGAPEAQPQAPVTQEAQPAAGAEKPPPAPAPEPARPVEVGYQFLEDQAALLSQWLANPQVERLGLGSSAGGRELFGVQFGAPGPHPLAQRATLFLVGGLDGTSLCGSQAVIAVVSELLADPESLPADAAFVAIPWANPDGLARWRANATGGGRNDRAIDDDGDGLVDEDGPDDLDRDGMILEMLREDPTGAWVRAEDPRFLRAAEEGEAPRFLVTREGADDDGDGLYNEDGPGGVCLDHNFPVGWEDCRGPESGPWPLSEPDSKALAELLLARRTAVVIAFQGNHGELASPGGRAQAQVLLAEDEPTYRRLADVFCSHTGRSQSRTPTLSQAHGQASPGSLVDWSYAALGALAFEIGVWGPHVQAGARGPVDAYFKSNAASDRESALKVSGVVEAWAHWLDDTRGGSGFLDWQPIQLQGEPSAAVGGWEPYTITNPPVDVLPQALHGLGAYVLDLARNLPHLEVDVREARREGKVCLVRARVKNLGTLPSGVGPGAQSSSVRLRLEITPGITLRAGQLEATVGHLPGRGTSDEYSWLLIAPEGSVVNIVVESAWSPPTVRGVHL